MVLLVVGAIIGLGRREVGSQPATPTDRTTASARGLGPAARPAPVDPAVFSQRPLTVVDTMETRGGGPVLPETTDRTLLVLEPVGMRLVDLRTGSHRLLRTVDTGLGSPSGDVIVTDRGVLVGVGGDVVRLEVGSRPVRLATDHRLVSAGGDRSTWLHTTDDSATGGTATLLRHDGMVLARLVVPQGTRPIAGTARRLVVGGPGTVAVLGIDGSRRVIANGDPLASDGRRVAWVDCADDRACAVVLGTVDDADRVRTTLTPTDRLAIGPPAGAFSPDGRWLAVPLPRQGSGEAAWSIAVLDTTTGIEALRLRGHADTMQIPMAWSPDARWLVADLLEGMVAWQPGRDELLLGGQRAGVLGLAMR